MTVARAEVFRLLQMLVRPAKIRRGGVLTDLDDAAADGAGAAKMLEQRFAVVAADRAGQLRQILLKVPPSIPARRPCWSRNTSRHIVAIGSREVGEIAKAPARI